LRLRAQFPRDAAGERPATIHSLFPKDMVDLAAYAPVLQHLGEIVAYLRPHWDARPGAPGYHYASPWKRSKATANFTTGAESTLAISKGWSPAHPCPNADFKVETSSLA